MSDLYMDKYIRVRLDTATRNRLDEMTETTQFSMSEIIRQLINNKPIRAAPTADYQQMIKELRAIGNNVNQLARVANSTGDIYRAEYMKLSEQIQAAILDIRRAVELP